MGINKVVPVCCLLVLCAANLFALGGKEVPLYQTKEAQSPDFFYVRALSEKECLLKAASQVSLRDRVIVSVVKTGNKQTVELDYAQNFPETLRDLITLHKQKKAPFGVEALYTVKGKTNFKVAQARIDDKADKDGKPRWIDFPPTGKSFYAGVGTITRNSDLEEGFTNSDMNAFGELCMQAGTPTQSGAQKTWKAQMRGAYIARRWYDEDTGIFYSLALLPL